MKRICLAAALVAVGCTSNKAEEANSCKELEKACLSSGYIVGGGMNPNTDLWNDCVLPVMNGKIAEVKNLDFSAETAMKCQKENPHFGTKGN